jgi:hypothetical protein
LAAPVGGTFEDDIICASDQRIAFDAVIAGLPCAMHPIARRDNGANRRRHRSRHRHRRNKRERACSCKGRPHGKSSKIAVLASPSLNPFKLYSRERAKFTANEMEKKNDPWGGAEDLVDEVRQTASDDACIAPRAAISRAIRNAACNAN